MNAMIKKIRVLSTLALVLAALLARPMAATAATGTNLWTGVDGGLWSAGGNWSLTTISATDTNLFNATHTVNFDTSATVGGILVTGATTTATITNTASTMTLSAYGLNVATSGSTLNLNPGLVQLGAAQTWTVASGAALNVGANVTNATFLLTITNAGAAVISGIVSGSGGLTKTGTGTLTLSANNTMTGGVAIEQGTLKYTTDQTTAVGALNFGISSNSTSIGALDLSGANLTAASLTYQVNNTTGGTITIGSGKSLNVNGTVLVGGINVGGTAKLAVTGAAGTWNISGGNFNVYQRPTGTGIGNDPKGILDMSALGTFNFNTAAGAFNFNVDAVNGGAVGVSGSGGGGNDTVTLAQTNVLKGTILTIGYNANNNHNRAELITPGGSVSTFAFDTIWLGRTFCNDGGGNLTLGSNATLTLGGMTGAAANMTVGDGANSSGTADFSAGTLNATLNALVIGNAQAGTFKFGAGTLTIASASIGNSAAGTFTISGGQTTVSNVFQMATNSSSQTATLNLTGGSLTLGTNITTAASASSSTSTITLNGGTLDLQNHAIGTAAAPIDNLNFQSGTLQNVSEINGGAGLTKTTGGTLILAGANTYSGGTTISAGTLQLGTGGSDGTVAGSIANNSFLTFNKSGSYNTTNTIAGAGTALMTVQGGGTNNFTGSLAGYSGNTTVTNATARFNHIGIYGGLITAQSDGTVGGTGTVSSVTMNAGSTLSPGNSPGTLTVTNTLTLNGNTNIFELAATNLYDQVVVQTQLTLTNAPILKLAFSAAFNPGDQFLLFTNTFAGVYSKASNFFLENAYYGTPQELVEGASFFAKSLDGSVTNSFAIHYNADGLTATTGGNDILLTVIPEPSTVQLLMFLGTAFAMRRRLRHSPGGSGKRSE